jgi:hypothetical protein
MDKLELVPFLGNIYRRNCPLCCYHLKPQKEKIPKNQKKEEASSKQPCVQYIPMHRQERKLRKKPKQNK